MVDLEWEIEFIIQYFFQTFQRGDLAEECTDEEFYLTAVGVSKLKLMKAWQQLKEDEQLWGTRKVTISLNGTKCVRGDEASDNFCLLGSEEKNKD